VKLLRLARLPRLYRLVRLIRLIRLLKMGDSFKKLFRSLHINQGIAKLMGVIFIILFLNHFVACLWYWLAEFMQPSDPDSGRDYWVVRAGLEEESDGMKYVAAIYWSFQTLTTVGYGDISAFRDYERLIALVWIILGCGFYSYTIGNLQLIMNEIDVRNS
jgi:hyperpolarization activated cyclic nucleotide-gated potassium channel 2